MSLKAFPRLSLFESIPYLSSEIIKDGPIDLIATTGMPQESASIDITLNVSIELETTRHWLFKIFLTLTYLMN